MNSEHILTLAKWVIVLVVGLVSVGRVIDQYHFKAELEARRECFASNERIAKTWAAANEGEGVSIRPSTLNNCGGR